MPGYACLSAPIRFFAGVAVLAGVSLWAGGPSAVSAQPQPQAAASAPAAPAVQEKPAVPAASAAVRPAPKAVAKNNNKPLVKPLWAELTPAQQQALAPLSAIWNTISEAQKRKWLALSENFPKMSGAEQAKLHSRMAEWVALSPQQRTQARLNFGEAKQLSADDKKAKWEAYQALPPEEKRKLAASATKPPATAAAIKPIAPEKLAEVPKPKRVRAPRPVASAPAPAEQAAAPPAPASAPAPVPAAVPTPPPAAN